MPKSNLCSECGEPIEGRYAHAKTCSDECKLARRRRLRKVDNLEQREGPLADAYRDALTPIVQNRIDDEVRDVFREEVRATISQRVRENVLGAAETLTELLPKAMAALAVDLESKDYMKRSKAVAYVLKYAMPLIDEPGKDMPGARVEVVLDGLSVPSTHFGEAFADAVEAEWTPMDQGRVHPDLPYDPVTNPEIFEQDWPICHMCGSRTPEESMRQVNQSTPPTCMTCHARRMISKGKIDGDATVGWDNKIEAH